jgi:hypothetical protein
MDKVQPQLPYRSKEIAIQRKKIKKMRNSLYLSRAKGEPPTFTLPIREKQIIKPFGHIEISNKPVK